MDDFANLCRVYKKICDKEPNLLSYNYRENIALKNENEFDQVWFQSGSFSRVLVSTNNKRFKHCI